ncbi:adenylate/guanylate cyclase domain-containing protein [Candidatus Nitrosocosmicus hydrocola]|uniref:adenylate/guanylate cyclase domain-containing protein n=1 Tax=Candidatus Nitrosocosmicus hydrocola TaxID=1826872 RepID=UPI000A808914|nr:adenylate/guanylate cyclase domain-containing protein [Candidatus Nitrosocosmicus hydrocola]
MVKESDEVQNQKTTILNLFNSGLEPETISLELDIDEDIVKNIIEDEKNKDKREKTESNISNYLMNKFYLDAIIDVEEITKESQIRTWNALKSKPELNIIVKETQSILEQHAESKLKLVMLHIDLVGSTKMALTLPIDRLTTIIRAFAQEMTKIIAMYGGYVLKYIGDAVLAFFVIEDLGSKEQPNRNGLAIDKEDRRVERREGVGDGRNGSKMTETKSIGNGLTSLQFSNVISCASTMIKVLKEGINPILNQYDYPELKVRVGIDYGEVAIVQYGIDIYEFDNVIFKTPHLDLIGYTISVAVKMTSLAEPDHMVIGQKLFDRLEDNLKASFKKVQTNTEIWSYSNITNDGLYSLFTN